MFILHFPFRFFSEEKILIVKLLLVLMLVESIIPSSRFAREFHPHATHETYGPLNRSLDYISLKCRIKASYLSNLFDKSNKKAFDPLASFSPLMSRQSRSTTRDNTVVFLIKYCR